MADNANVRTGLKTLIQDNLSDKAVNLLVNIMPLVYFLLLRDGNKRGNMVNPGSATSAYGLGRPGAGFLLTGVPVSKTRREQILGGTTYMPIIQVSNPPTSDGKVLAQRDTMPTRANWATNSPVTRYKRPFFKWVERCDPISVPKKDIRTVKQQFSGNKKAASAAIGDLFKAESDNVLNTHFTWWNQHFWGTDQTVGYNGYPSDVDQDAWDDIYSLKQALRDDNMYAGVDRTQGANAFWKGNCITAHRNAVLEDRVNEANYTLGMAKKGSTVNLILCGGSLFPQFAAEARQKGGVVLYDGMPDTPGFGFKRPIARYNNTFVVYDPECPDKTHASGAYTKNAMVGLNLDTMTIAIHPDANVTVDEPFDQSKVKGGTDEITSNVRTQAIVGCEAPSLNVWWDDVG